MAKRKPKRVQSTIRCSCGHMFRIRTVPGKHTRNCAKCKKAIPVRHTVSKDGHVTTIVAK